MLWPLTGISPFGLQAVCSSELPVTKYWRRNSGMMAQAGLDRAWRTHAAGLGCVERRMYKLRSSGKHSSAAEKGWR